MRLGQIIRKWRIVQEVSLRDLAKEIGTSAATLHRFECGHDIDGRTLSMVLTWCFGKVAQP